jgi:hypothetical protein
MSTSKKQLLTFSKPTNISWRAPKRNITKINLPSFSRQSAHFYPKFKALEKEFNQGVEIKSSYLGAQPESVIVLEIRDTIEDFNKAVKDLRGLSFLTEFEESSVLPDENFHYKTKEKTASDKTLKACFYMIMSTTQGIKEILSLWDRWEKYQQDPKKFKFERGQAKWRNLLSQLSAVRVWGPEDRLRETGLEEEWIEREQLEGKARIRVEVELWFREHSYQRQEAFNIIKSLVEEAGGQIIGSQSVIREIAYHGILAEMPIEAVRGLLTKQTKLVLAQQVMFIRPAGQISFGPYVEAPLFEDELPINDKPSDLTPVVALFDGLPLENHQRLNSKIIVDDPENWASQYPVADRIHGTAMASLIINGELDSNEEPLVRSIYIRPILKPDPKDILIVELIYKSVRRLFDSIDGIPPVAPNIKIINFSIGNSNYPFYHYPSPLARLIDWLSFRYKVLFIISAGNHTKNIDLGLTKQEFETLKASPDLFNREIFQFVRNNAPLHRILSPAESINSLTVGALYSDTSNGKVPAYNIELFSDVSIKLPSPISAQGLGFSKSVKPELMYPGGRIIYSPASQLLVDKIYLRPILEGEPGQKVASPGNRPGEINATRHLKGTSNATALATRSAAQIYETLLILQTQLGKDAFQNEYFPLLIKGLLVHSTAWGETQKKLLDLLGGQSGKPKQDKDLVSSFIGYGQAITDNVLFCTDQRATLLGWGMLNHNEGHDYLLPLPSCLSAQKVFRRLKITLAWFSPIEPSNKKYKRVNFSISLTESEEAQNEVKNILKTVRTDAFWQTVTNGTVQHEIFEGDSATPYQEDAFQKFRVICRSNGGVFDALVPYAMVVTLEVAPETGLNIYDEIKQKIQPVVKVNPSV